MDRVEAGDGLKAALGWIALWLCLLGLSLWLGGTKYVIAGAILLPVAWAIFRHIEDAEGDPWWG